MLRSGSKTWVLNRGGIVGGEENRCQEQPVCKMVVCRWLFPTAHGDMFGWMAFWPLCWVSGFLTYLVWPEVQSQEHNVGSCQCLTWRCAFGQVRGPFLRSWLSILSLVFSCSAWLHLIAFSSSPLALARRLCLLQVYRTQPGGSSAVSDLHWFSSPYQSQCTRPEPKKGSCKSRMAKKLCEV